METIANHNFFEWTMNTDTKECSGSEALLEMCGLDSQSCQNIHFLTMIHPSHKNRLTESIKEFANIQYYHEQFQLLTKFGYQWVDSKVDDITINSKGETIATGHLNFLDEDNVAIMQNLDSQRRFNDLITHYSTISNSLLDFLHQKDISTVIDKTLNNLLDEFGGDRVYIFEYDRVNNTQSCAYEVVGASTKSTQAHLQDLPLSSTKWWTEQLMVRNIPIIYDNIQTMIEDAPDEYEILQQQGICSIMAVPLITKDGVGGYLGIDIVGRRRVWTNANIQWFQSLANIISLCIGLRKSEEQAQSERAHYRRLYDNMPIGFIRLDLVYDIECKPIDFILKEINPVAHLLFNTTNETAIGKRSSEIYDIVALDQLEVFDKLIKSRGSIHGETKNKNGRFFNYTMYSIERAEVIVLIQDNTESIKSAHALRKSEATLQNIYKNIPVGIEIYDKNGDMVRVNEIEMEIFGFTSSDDVKGANLFNNPNIPQAFLDDLRNQRPTWCDFFYDFDNLNDYYKCHYTGKKHIILKGSILYDADNNVENYMLIVLDNTDSLQAKNKIHKFEQLFNSIAEFSEVGLCQWNPGNKTIAGTDQWFNNLYCSNHHIDNMLDAYTNAHPDDYVKLKQGFQDMIAGKITSFRDETRISHKDGWKWLRTNYKVSEYNPQENHIEIIGINIDITELKNTEHKLTEAKIKAEESDRLKSAFLANMSHEIRTPLNAIVGFSDLLIETDEIEERQQYMSIIRGNNDLLLQLISDILDISKIESGMLDINYDTVCLDEVCKEIMVSYPTNGGEQVPVIFDTPHPEITLYTDRVRLLQVLCNLVNNARKFTKTGSINIGYNIENNQVLFYVKDTGIGIPKHQRENIFTRFIKINSFTPGTGLGLPICKSIIEKMGGTIWVESENGNGSCFWFSQPHNNSDKNSTTPTHHPLADKQYTPIAAQDNVKPTILVAEDTDSNYLLVESMLKKQYTLIRACNGMEAVDLFKKHNPNLVLMDMKMPVMNGLEASKLIKQINPDIAIIVLTAFAYDNDRLLAFEAGCSEYITKPLSLTKLQEAIKRYIA